MIGIIVSHNAHFFNIRKSLHENEAQMRKILRKFLEHHNAKFPKLSVFVGQISILRHYYIQNVENGTPIRVYEINKESVTHFS